MIDPLTSLERNRGKAPPSKLNYVWDEEAQAYRPAGVSGITLSPEEAARQANRMPGDTSMVGGPVRAGLAVGRAAQAPSFAPEGIAELMGKAGPLLARRGVGGLPGQMLAKTAMGAGQPAQMPQAPAVDPEAEAQAELDRARETGNRRRLSANIGRAGDTIASAISGAPSQAGYWDRLGQGAERDVDFATDRLGATRALLAKRQALEQAASGAKATADYRAANLALRERELAKKGQGGGGMSASLAYRMGRDQLEDQRRRDEQRMKLEKEQRERSVPGFESDNTASAEDAKKMKASLASAERMKRYVGELRDLHSRVGTEMVGPDSVRMGQLLKAIQLEGKNIGELGALSGPDMGLIEELVGVDPTSLGANAKALFGVDNTQAALDGLDKWVSDTLGGNAATYGYKPNAAASQAQPTSGIDLAQPASVTIRRKSDGVTKTVAADKAQRFLADPNYEQVR